MKVQNRLKYWRHSKMMNQKEFAENLGIATTTYCNYENQTRQPSLAQALQIAQRLGCKVEEVFSLEP